LMLRRRAEADILKVLWASAITSHSRKLALNQATKKPAPTTLSDPTLLNFWDYIS